MLEAFANLIFGVQNFACGFITNHLCVSSNEFDWCLNPFEGEDMILSKGIGVTSL
uniref:Uncharacterized protein n=1 Tax=Rhizophagus irregularis (strain DAOM 181602 / DAOM 197198 / MUCL 43194) TaxID=747089 RepID=U9TAI8_RHIID